MGETHSSALLVMDVQPGIVDRLEQKDSYIDKVTKAVAVAHKNHIPVLYVVVGFREGFPEISPKNKSFSGIKDSQRAAMVNPQPVLALEKGDLVVVKHRVSAFSGSDLDMLLRAQDIQHIVLSGIATSGVVLSTLREAADKDFQITVLSDLCADFDQQVHDVLVEKVFPRQAEIMTSEQWMSIQKGHDV
jgi:nicotinamidase-related amidase